MGHPIKTKRRTFKAEQVKEALDQLTAMLDCAIEREDEETQRALCIAMPAVRLLLGDGTSDASCPWPVEK